MRLIGRRAPTAPKELREPFQRLFTQGMIRLDGAKMSKSRGNLVTPEEIIDQVLSRGDLADIGTPGYSTTNYLILGEMLEEVVEGDDDISAILTGLAGDAGLDRTAISYTKGCYIGQETVVMLENRGKAPKVLWRWAIEGSVAPAAQTPITVDDAVDGKPVSPSGNIAVLI